jgi:upstream activation factor subunit UAF30
VRERFDVVEAKRNGAEEPVPSVETADVDAVPPPQTNGVHKIKSMAPSTGSPSVATTPAKREASSATLSDLDDSAPPKKKRKPSAEDDAALAARLQAEENSLARPTRGGGARKTAPVKKKKTPKKKTKVRVAGSDDSDLEDESPRAVNRNTGFHKLLNLSPALSSLLGGATQMSRPQVTKHLWMHIKANDLQEPSDKRYINCDAPMREIFKQDKINMFTMTKLVNQHMYNPEE